MAGSVDQAPAAGRTRTRPQVWRRGAAVAWVGGGSDGADRADRADRVVLLDLDHPAEPPRILAGSAAVIWDLLDGQRDEDAVVAAVAAHFAVPVAEVEQPVRDFLAGLDRAGLVVPA